MLWGRAVGFCCPPAFLAFPKRCRAGDIAQVGETLMGHFPASAPHAQPFCPPHSPPRRQFRIWGALLFRPITNRKHTARPEPQRGHPAPRPHRAPHSAASPLGHPNPTDPIGASRPQSTGMLQRSHSREWRPLHQGEVWGGQGMGAARYGAAWGSVGRWGHGEETLSPLLSQVVKAESKG